MTDTHAHTRTRFAAAFAALFFAGAVCGAVARADLPGALAAPAASGTGVAPPGASARDAGSGRARPLANTAEADRQLSEIVGQQNAIFAAMEAAGDRLVAEDYHSRFQQLTQRYDRLLRVYPNYVPGCVAYGLLLGRLGMKKEGAVFMHRADQLDGSLAVVKNQLGNLCAEEGRPLDAFAFYTAAIALEPKEPLYHYQLGALLGEARDLFLKNAPGMWTPGKIDAAMQGAFQQAMDLAPGDWRYAYRYGLSFYDINLKEWEQALQFWEAFETRLKPGIEQQVCRVHQAKILVELRRLRDAQTRLDTVTAPELLPQKTPVAAALDEARKKQVADQSRDSAAEPRKSEEGKSEE